MSVFFTNCRTKFHVHVCVIFTSLFLYPHLFYGIELYADTYYSNLDKLVKLNNKLLRILQGKNRRSNVTDLYVNHRTLPLTLLHHFAVLVFVHKFVHHRHALPDVFYNYFISNSLIYNYATRQKAGLHLCSVNTTLGQRSIQYKGCVLWIKLPSELQEPMSVNRFKTLLKLHLLNCIDY